MKTKLLVVLCLVFIQSCASSKASNQEEKGLSYTLSTARFHGECMNLANIYNYQKVVGYKEGYALIDGYVDYKAKKAGISADRLVELCGEVHNLFELSVGDD